VDNFKEISAPIRYLITAGNLTDQNYSENAPKTLETIRSAVETDISLIQIREKFLPAKSIFQLTKSVLEITRSTNTKVLINERIDIALAAKAVGVHLTSGAIPTQIIRQNVPENFIIGVSTHSLDTALQARQDGADFVTFSPIFPTTSKAKFGQPQGLEKLRVVCGKLGTFPVLALGGINKDNVQSTIDNGASGFAGISYFQT
jgi:thiamine-phosphate pyrophosphorylase